MQWLLSNCNRLLIILEELLRAMPPMPVHMCWRPTAQSIRSDTERQNILCTEALGWMQCRTSGDWTEGSRVARLVLRVRVSEALNRWTAVTALDISGRYGDESHDSIAIIMFWYLETIFVEFNRKLIAIKVDSPTKSSDERRVAFGRQWVASLSAIDGRQAISGLKRNKRRVQWLIKW